MYDQLHTQKQPQPIWVSNTLGDPQLVTLQPDASWFMLEVRTEVKKMLETSAGFHQWTNPLLETKKETTNPILIILIIVCWLLGKVLKTKELVPWAWFDILLRQTYRIGQLNEVQMAHSVLLK